MSLLEYFVLFVIAVRYVMLGYVISKHGQEKPSSSYDGWSFFFAVATLSVLFYLHINHIL